MAHFPWVAACHSAVGVEAQTAPTLEVAHTALEAGAHDAAGVEDRVGEAASGRAPLAACHPWDHRAEDPSEAASVKKDKSGSN